MPLCVFQVMTLTNEGGRLRRNTVLEHGRDFELLPEPVWKALSAWYGGSPVLPRTVRIYQSDSGSCPLGSFDLFLNTFCAMKRNRTNFA